MSASDSVLTLLPQAASLLPSHQPHCPKQRAPLPSHTPPPRLVLCSGKLPTLPRVSFPWLLRVQTAVPPSGLRWERSLQKPSGNGRIGTHSLNKPRRPQELKVATNAARKPPNAACFTGICRKQAGSFLAFPGVSQHLSSWER